MNALLIVKVRGYSRAITVIDHIVKNAFVEHVKMSFEKKNGEINLIFKGSDSQICEAELIFKDYAEHRSIDCKILKILKFDFSIFDEEE